MLLVPLAWQGRAESPPSGVTPFKTAAAAIAKFLDSRMTDPATGAVFVNAVDDRPAVAGEARNHDALSETAGQLMEWAILRGDRELFERQLHVVKSRFLGESSGFLAWKISLDPARQADTSATLDDWRVAWACRVAARIWSSAEVGAFGKALAERLARGSTGQFIPPPAFNLGDGSPGTGAVLLCYLHLPAMQEFAEDIAECRDLYANSLRVLNGIKSARGMIPAKWDPETREYSAGASDEVLALITLLYWHDREPDNPRVRDAVDVRLRHFREHGSLPQAFDSSTGDALHVPAGASVYALWTRLLLACGHPEDAAAAIRKMLEFQSPPDGEFPGAIGGYPVFVFDQVEALLALEAYFRTTGAGASDRSRIFTILADAWPSPNTRDPLAMADQASGDVSNSWAQR